MNRSLCLPMILLVAAGCGSSITGPADLNVSLELSAHTVRFGEMFFVRLRIENPTDVDVTLATPMGCLALPGVYQDGYRLDWEGTALLCLAAFTDHLVPARGELVREFELRAALHGGDDAFAYEVPPRPGAYVVRMEVYAPLGDLSAELLVVP